MRYRIDGLAPGQFAPLFAMNDAALARRNARRVFADAPAGYPCRVSLDDAGEGEELLLLHHVSLDSATPFRAANAIFVRKGALAAASFRDEAPLYLRRRTIGLRGFGADGMMKDALLAMPGEADAKIRALLGNEEIDEIHAHNAARGCFLARIVRD